MCSFIPMVSMEMGGGGAVGKSFSHAEGGAQQILG